MTADEPQNRNGLAEAEARALEVRALYEKLEDRMLGRTWTLPELAVGFTNDAAYAGRLVLAAERTWDIDGDVDAELRHKLAECLWWVFVLADRLGVDMPQAYAATMDRIARGCSGRCAAPGSDPAGGPARTGPQPGPGRRGPVRGRRSRLDEPVEEA